MPYNAEEDRIRYQRLADTLRKVGGTPPPTPPTLSAASPSKPAVTPPAVANPAAPSLATYFDPQDRAAQEQRGRQILANLPTIGAENATRRSGGALVDVLPIGVNPGQRVVAQPSVLTGETRLMESSPQAAPRPLYRTEYGVYGQGGRQGTATITGPDQRAGGGTLSVLDQGNGGTVEGNVAAMNRQAEALRSLREARNPGITTGGPSLLNESAPSVDPFSRPGDSFGDSQMRRAQYESLLKDAGRPGMTRAERGAMVEGAQGLLAPGLAAMQQQGQQWQQQGQQQMGLSDLASRERIAQLGLQGQQATQADELALRQQQLGIQQQTVNAAQAESQQKGALLGAELETRRRILSLQDRLASSSDDKERLALSQQIQQLSGHNPTLTRIQMIDVPNPDPASALFQPYSKQPLDLATGKLLTPDQYQPAPAAPPQKPVATPSKPKPSANDIAVLQRHPELRPQFDAEYGAGASAQYFENKR